jgi:acyl-CoA dehydrogenase
MMLDMNLDTLTDPHAFLEAMLGGSWPQHRRFTTWWEAHGKAISAAVDRAGTPGIRQYERLGARVDEILLLPDYWRMLHEGYREGVIWRAFSESLKASFIPGYLTAYYDVGLYCPYTVSLGTAMAIDKYASPEIRDLFLPTMLVQDDAVWQGATWMTEVGGGSDLGSHVHTIARQQGDRWLLTGEKYFCSNVGAELAVVAARPEGGVDGVRGLALFLVPRTRDDGTLNYYIRRLKDKIATRSVPTGEVELRESEAYLLGEAAHGIYLIMEVLNLSRTCNSVGSVALAQRALTEAYTFACGRVAFGKALIDQPLMRRQFETKTAELRAAFALAWASVEMADEVWREPAPRYSDRFHLYRLVTHLAKYWTAEVAVQMAKWAMEVNGGAGTVADYGVERWLREAMIVDIWEGPPHRQILDGIEVMERKGAHRALFDLLSAHSDPAETDALRARIDAHLALPQDEKEAGAEAVFDALAAWAATAYERRLGK